MPPLFRAQRAIVDELLREVARMEAGEKRSAQRRTPPGYERELRLAGLAQRIAQGYTAIESVLSFVARRLDRAPVTGDDWHKALIARCSQPFESPPRAAVFEPTVTADLLELCQFRHVVRNIYPTRLEEDRVRDNLERLIRAARAFAEAWDAFARTAAPRRPRRRKPARR